MNKSELSAHVATQTAETKATADSVVGAVFAAIGEALVHGEKVSIPGFGSFTTKTRPTRQGRNPRTGERIAIAASTTSPFKAAPRLKRHRSPPLLQAATVHQHPPTPTAKALSDRRRSTHSRRSDLLTAPISKQRGADAIAAGTCTSKTASTLTGGPKNRRSTNPPQSLCHRVRTTL